MEVPDPFKADGGMHDLGLSGGLPCDVVCGPAISDDFGLDWNSDLENCVC